ncbi:hypothetical protein CT0861_01338 [Colletotrichum tofieldiae]|uniref:Uncharacterized protein n=1 Tax=Colletotrichum tofieldiae TaxID=708197 RepID=A0A166TU32_9PEZI|nr:hypothetical protein CT0861_01338 [Colletotrichum tofieldiae]
MSGNPSIRDHGSRALEIPGLRVYHEALVDERLRLSIGRFRFRGLAPGQNPIETGRPTFCQDSIYPYLQILSGDGSEPGCGVIVRNSSSPDVRWEEKEADLALSLGPRDETLCVGDSIPVQGEHLMHPWNRLFFGRLCTVAWAAREGEKGAQDLASPLLPQSGLARPPAAWPLRTAT